MTKFLKKILRVCLLLFRFTGRVLNRFYLNKGLLLASAVGYNALLSLIPLLTVCLSVLTRFVDSKDVLHVVENNLSFAFASQTGEITETLHSLIENNAISGVVGFSALLFFSTIAFRMLEDAMSVIFRHHGALKKRHFLTSFAIPFFFIVTFSIGLLSLTLFLTTWETLDVEQNTMSLTLDWIRSQALLVKSCAFVGQVLIFTLFYRILPQAHVRFKLALFGGVFAATLWSGTRAALVWYFTNVSMVNVLYGSLATIILILVSLEVAAIILLLGAQMIAELEISADAGLPWHQSPRTSRSGRYLFNS